MDLLKTFIDNAAKGPGEERDSYTSSGGRDTEESTLDTSDAAAPTTTRSTKSTSSQQTPAQLDASVDYDKDVTAMAPKVHERVHKTIVDENQTEIDRDHHVDHYKQKIQPLHVKKVDATTDSAGVTSHEDKVVDKRHGEETKRAIVEQDAKVADTQDEDVTHMSVQKDDIVHDKTHHHVHERVQPVIEKDVYQTEVRHNKRVVKEDIKDEDIVEQTETLPTKEVQQSDL